MINRSITAILSASSSHFLACQFFSDFYFSDISDGDELYPVRVVNDVDDAVIPPFTYIFERELGADVKDLIRRCPKDGRTKVSFDRIVPLFFETLMKCFGLGVRCYYLPEQMRDR